MASKPERAKARTRTVKPTIGWREWVSLPDLDIERIKAKIDTGARTSALHATDLEYFTRDGRDWVRFTIRPAQRSGTGKRRAAAPIADRRPVVSSSGASELRPFIETTIVIGGRTFPIELNLTDRSDMGFRMLLGRAAVKRRFLVDPGRSYLNSQSTARR